MNYKMILEYDGTSYNGWQKQGNTDRTIQGKLEELLKKMTGEDTEVAGSGRTDAGVHALGQVANFRLKEYREPGELLEEMNRYLPQDIRVLELKTASERFHSRWNALRKTYVYRIDRGAKPSVFYRKYRLAYSGPLHVERMREAADCLLGTHDFKSFCANKRMKKSTVRCIHDIRIEEQEEVMSVYITGNGFLHHMVRIIVGTLLEVGNAQRSAASVRDVLEKCDRAAAGQTAPPHGLFLLEVEY